MGNNYTVYKHDTKKEKKYIGITKQKPIHRWLNGLGYQTNIHFSRAIQRYGWDNIKHKILFEQLTKDEATEQERQLIQQYQTDNLHYGYNKTPGGDCGRSYTLDDRKKISDRMKGKRLPDYITERSKIVNSQLKKGKPEPNFIKHNETLKKKVNQYSKDGTYIKTYDSISDAARENNSSTGNICAAITGKHRKKNAVGYIWKYADQPTDAQASFL
jgi:hypothetical protein